MLAQDYPNLRAALTWSREQGDIEALARMAAALSLFWTLNGPYHEGAEWLDDACQAEGLPVGLRGQVMFGRSFLAIAGPDPATAIVVGEEGLLLAHQLGDDRLAARMAANLGGGRWFLGMLDPVLEEGIDLARQSGDQFALALLLHHIGLACINLDPPRARPAEVVPSGGPVRKSGGRGVVAGYVGLGRLV